MKLLRTEWLKIKNYPAFWWVFGIIALSYPGVNYIMYNMYLRMTESKDTTGQMAKALIGNPFSFPEAWHTVAFFSSFFIFIPAILVIMLITNEYTYKTHRQNVIDGWSRQQFMIGKLLDVVIVSGLITALYIIVCSIMGAVNSGDATTGADKTHFIGLFALQTFSQLSLAFTIGLLVRKSFIALAIFIFYIMILEPFLVAIMKFKLNDTGRFLPLEISDRMIPMPAFLGKMDSGYQALMDSIGTHVGLSLVFTLALWAFNFWLNGKRDL